MKTFAPPFANYTNDSKKRGQGKIGLKLNFKNIIAMRILTKKKLKSKTNLDFFYRYKMSILLLFIILGQKLGVIFIIA